MNVVAVTNALSSQVENYFRQQGWHVARGPMRGYMPLMVRDRLDARALEDALKAPWRGGIEMADSALLPMGACLLRHLSEDGLCLVLRSDTAYANEIPPLFVAALQDRLLAAESDTSELEFVIHEMVSNAILHGNFAIHGHLADDENSLERYEQQLEQAQASPELCRRRIQLSASLSDGRLEIAVEDDGPGFDHDSLTPDPVRPHGLELVAEMAAELRIEENGRRAVAVFPFHPRQHGKPVKSLSDTHVLIVDDKMPNRELLAALLGAIGVGHIEQASDGVEGLAALQRAKPDLVLLDVMMPRMDGHEMCRQLRQLYPLADLPVIFITALDGPADRFACFAAGGTDVMAKPFNNSEVIARVGVHLQLGLMMDKLRVFQERVQEELLNARSAQLALTPTPEQMAQVSLRTGLELEGLMETSSELGGDFWTIINAGPRRLCVLMADFTGHGTTAAFNVFRLHLLLSRLPRQIPSPSALMDYLNDELRTVLKPGQFASIFAGLIDLDTDSLTFASAAAPPPVILMENAAPRYLDSEGPPLGAFASPDYEETTVPFPPGSKLLIYSDALIESEVEGKLVCDDETLLHWMAEAGTEHNTASEILRRFHDILPGDPPDDLTLVSISRPA